MKRLPAYTLFLALLLVLSACGPADSGTVPPSAPPDASPEEPPVQDGEPLQEDSGGDVTVYDCGGVRIALPNRCLDRLTVQTEFSGPDPGWTPLISVSETASMEAAEADWGDSGGMGFLFGFGIADQTLFEQILREGGGTGIEIFARDGDGLYYARSFPTDVRYYRGENAPAGESEDWKTWEELNALAPEVQADLIARNGLTPYTLQEFYDQEFTYDSQHVYLNYSTGSVFDGKEEFYTLVLSQPVRQGEGGIWCVERMTDQDGRINVWFPVSEDGPAEEYYAALQEECDKGGQADLLTPLGAARRFVKESYWFLHTANPENFEETDPNS